MTLDFIKALLWPAVVVVGFFWLFRSEVRTLLGRPVGAVVALGGPAARGLLDAGLPRGQLCETGLLEFRDR